MRNIFKNGIKDFQIVYSSSNIVSYGCYDCGRNCIDCKYLEEKGEYLYLHFEIISFRLFNSLSLENKIWNFSLRHNMHLFVIGEYALAFSFMYH